VETNSITVGVNGHGVLNLEGGAVRITNDTFNDVKIGQDPNTSSGTINFGNGGNSGLVVAERILSLVPVGQSTVNFNHNEDDFWLTRNSTPNSAPVELAHNLTVNHIGSGRTILAGDNSHVGGTNIDAGVLEVRATGALGNGPVTISDGTLVIFDGLSLDDAITLTGEPKMGAHVNDTATVSSNLQGSDDGADSLTKVLEGTLILTGDNTYGGGIAQFVDGTTVREGTLVVNGGSISHPNRFVSVGDVDGDNGALHILSGGSMDNFNAGIGGGPGSVGAALVDGAGSRWDNNLLVVGGQGDGALTVSDDAIVTVATDALHLGLFAGTEGTLNIGDGGGAGFVSAPMVSGGDGDATLNFNHNDADYDFDNPITGSVHVKHLGPGTTTLSRDNTYTGGTNINSGEVRVTGAINHIENLLVIGENNGDDADLRITDGGDVTSRFARIAASAGSIGHAEVSGVGSTWTNMDENGLNDIHVGLSGVGSLEINDQGLVESRNGTIGLFADGDGSAVVSGAGSHWLAEGGMIIGGDGDGELTIKDDGLVTTGGNIGFTLADAAGSTGVLNIGDGGAPGVLSTFGDVSSGAGDAIINFNHTAEVTCP